jgi:hypothetical protein
MAGETPEAWIGQEVLLYLWKSEDLGTEAHAAVLRGIDSSGVTAEGSQGHNLSFYPWSTVREIMFGQNQDSG